MALAGAAPSASRINRRQIRTRISKRGSFYEHRSGYRDKSSTRAEFNDVQPRMKNPAVPKGGAVRPHGRSPASVGAMITKLSHVTVFVEDEDRAKEFYTEQLGFEVRSDATLEGFRWLTVGPKA